VGCWVEKKKSMVNSVPALCFSCATLTTRLGSRLLVCVQCCIQHNNGTENQRAVIWSCAFMWKLCRISYRKRVNRSALLPPLLECQPYGRAGERGVWQTFGSWRSFAH
jgi:hypothetical protein